jgi:hypothetical protein
MVCSSAQQLWCHGPECTAIFHSLRHAAVSFTESYSEIRKFVAAFEVIFSCSALPQNVLTLHITVENAMAIQKSQSRKHLRHDLEYFSLWEAVTSWIQSQRRIVARPDRGLHLELSVVRLPHNIASVHQVADTEIAKIHYNANFSFDSTCPCEPIQVRHNAWMPQGIQVANILCKHLPGMEGSSYLLRNVALNRTIGDFNPFDGNLLLVGKRHSSEHISIGSRSNVLTQLVTAIGQISATLRIPVQC